MSDNTPAVAGVQSCGCITLVDCAPGPLDKDTQKELAEIVAQGGEVRRSTVGEIKADPNFFPVHGCPHEPKGWEFPVWEPKVRLTRGGWIYVQVEEHGWEQLRGKVVRFEDEWWLHLTENDESVGPFRVRREAVDEAVEAAKELAHA